MAAQLEAGLLATELADYLVRRGLPFREAHHLVGSAVRRAEERGVPLTELGAAELAVISPHFGPDTAEVLTVSAALAARDLPGGAGPGALRAQLAAARRLVGQGDQQDSQ